METRQECPQRLSGRLMRTAIVVFLGLAFVLSGWSAMAEQGPLVKSYEIESSVYKACNQATGLMQSGAPTKACDVLKQAAANDPTSYSSHVHLLLAQCYRSLKNLPQAEAEAQLSLKFGPTNDRALYQLAIISEDEGKYDTSIKLLNDLAKSTKDGAFAGHIKKTVKSITVYKNMTRAQKCLDQGRNADAKQYLEAAASLDPSDNSADIHSNLAFVLERTGNPERAIVEGKKALQFDPNQKNALYTIGIAYQDTGKFDDAISWLRRYVQVETDSVNRDKAEKFIQELADDRVKLDPKANSTPDYLDQLKENDAVQMWPQEKLPVKVYIDPGKGVSGYRPLFRPFVIRSLNTWYEASGKKLSYKIVEKKSDADIVVQWTQAPLSMEESGRSRQKAGLTSVQADSNKKINNALVRIRTVNGFDPNRVITDGEAASVTMHEMGHSLGLGHSTGYSDIMYFGASSKQSGFPSSRDKATIARLYKDYPVVAFTEQKTAIPANIEYLPPPAFMPPLPTNTDKMDPPFFVPPPAQDKKLEPPMFVPPPLEKSAAVESKKKPAEPVAQPFFVPPPK